MRDEREHQCQVAKKNSTSTSDIYIFFKKQFYLHKERERGKKIISLKTNMEWEGFMQIVFRSVTSWYNIKNK